MAIEFATVSVSASFKPYFAHTTCLWVVYYLWRIRDCSIRYPKCLLDGERQRATFNEKHHPECISRVRTRPTGQTLHSIADNTSSRIIYYITLLCLLSKTYSAFANNSRSSRITCSNTLPNCSNAFCVHIFCNQLFIRAGSRTIKTV